MFHLHLPCCSLLLTVFISIAQSQPPATISTDPSYYYHLCAPSSCGNFSSIKYPYSFQTPCHPPNVQSLCRNNETFIIYNPLDTDIFRVLSLNYINTSITSVMHAADSLFTCGTHISQPNYRLNRNTDFALGYAYNTIGTHLNCTVPIPPGLIRELQTAPCLGCDGEDPENICYYAPGFVSAPHCETFFLFTLGGPFNASGVGNLRAYLQKGYEQRYTKTLNCIQCENSGGRCGSNPYSDSGQFVCFCESSVHPLNCSDGIIEDLSNWANTARNKESRHSKAIITAIVVPTSVVVLGVIVVTVLLYLSKRRHAISFDNSINAELSLRKYSYSQLKKITDDFSLKLGDGGFGSVYKGMIHGSECDVHVAVKVLKQSTQTKKQFISEITTVGSIHHDNLVLMLGYCIEGDTHALVYEFMENKSLDKHIYKIANQCEATDESTSALNSLNLQQTYSIALQTARGILYLHNGCSKKILHCDIKPANVLLDSNFSAKVADFGLSRMIGKDHSHVSLTGAQGTPGYAAPEIWLKTIGPVSEKSDVYSYGMLILEMIGRRKNYHAEASCSSQVYFPEWLFNNITNFHSPSVMRGLGGGDSFESAWNVGNWNQEEKRKFRRMCLVGLWCIQYLPSDRPTMIKVIQMLEGIVEIGIPKHPFPQQSFTRHGRESCNDFV